jgi:hypothetical protein
LTEKLLNKIRTVKSDYSRRYDEVAGRNKMANYALWDETDVAVSVMRLILPAALGPGVYSASNRNEYQKQKNNVSGE